ncbi:adenylosuccinate lyase family protein [Fusobacterium sp.]|uniref:class-II fumarase/aspartase family protein n=1 Tax=Fusobacterium sp. TaxID=68766 RepID=UPI002900C901|nr:adenylosuccinate lyase family protein [Fusobacterium sp.]MDU1910429.1 adenylosuccinate lyase family protein [Fusobacterium sp.]
MRALYDSKSKTMNYFGIKELMSKEAKYQVWLDIEAALAKAQSEFGIIPKKAAENIGKAAKIEYMDFKLMDEIYKKIGHGFVPFIKVFIKACDKISGENESSKYIHYGVTTQNIQQSGQLIILKQLHEKYLLICSKILENLAKLAEDNKNSVMAGRTHGKHAIPITYGYKVSVWISDILTSIERMEEVEKRIFKIMMGGAVGAFNTAGEIGRKIQNRVAEILEMYSMEVPSRNITSHKEEYIMIMALLANNCHKIAEEVYSTSIEEYGEVSEAYEAGTIGSSTMPQKINPKLAKGIIANSQKLYSIVPMGLYSGSRPFEADSSSYMLFDAALEETMELTTEILLRTEELTRTVQVFKDRMYQNTLNNKGLDNSEYIMMKIAEKLGKDKAHSIIYKLAIKSETEHKDYLQLLKEDELLSSIFDENDIKNLLKPENYIGLSSQLAIEMAEKARKKAVKIKKYKV